MPYIDKDSRILASFYGELESVVNFFSKLDHEEFPGLVNYLNYLIVVRRFGKKSPIRRYFAFAGWVGTMICCVLEVYRRVIAPYEDEAIERNGDVS